MFYRSRYYTNRSNKLLIIGSAFCLGNKNTDLGEDATKVGGIYFYCCLFNAESKTFIGWKDRIQMAFNSLVTYCNAFFILLLRMFQK